MAPHSDPEVARLIAAARELTKQAHRLSRSIDETVEELDEFTQSLAAHRAAVTYSGPERRQHERPAAE